jgi:hypothetical protein
VSTEYRVSAEDALRRAFWTVKVPSLALLLAPLLGFIVLAKLRYIPGIGYAGMKWAIPTFFISFVGAWLVWSIQVPRWRLWAYRRVTDIGRLKMLAVERQIVWKDGSIFEKTEIMSRSVRDELHRLEAASGNGA